MHPLPGSSRTSIRLRSPLDLTSAPIPTLTTFGQHEPSLAVSRVNTNTVVVASKDYRNGNQKEVWIDVSNDGGVTWPANLQLQMPGIDPASSP